MHPMELKILPRRDVRVALVLLLGDLGNRVELLGRHETVRLLGAEHEVALLVPVSVEAEPLAHEEIVFREALTALGRSTLKRLHDVVERVAVPFLDVFGGVRHRPTLMISYLIKYVKKKRKYEGYLILNYLSITLLPTSCHHWSNSGVKYLTRTFLYSFVLKRFLWGNCPTRSSMRLTTSMHAEWVCAWIMVNKGYGQFG